MNPTHLMQIPATWTTRRPSPTARDADGNPSVVETSQTILCWVAPLTAIEDTDRQDRQTATFTAYVPPDASIAGPDRLDIGGVTYEATGPSEPWIHPRSAAVIFRTVPVRVVL